MMYYTEGHIEEIQRGYEVTIVANERRHKKEKEHLVKTLQQVVACFNSVDDSSTCINDHHPSCLVFIEARLKELNGGLQG